MRSPKQPTKPEATAEANQQPENASKVDNTNLIAFKRIKGTGEQETTIHYLKDCTNCKKKYTTEKRDTRTCSDKCNLDNKTRGAECHVWEANPADIASDFDINNYPKRNETRTPHQIKREAERQAEAQAEAQQAKKRAEAHAKRKEEQAKAEKAHQKKLQKFLHSLPENLDEAVKKIVQENNTKERKINAFIYIDFERDNLLFIVSEDTHGNLFATIPYADMIDNFIEEIKNTINPNQNKSIIEILQGIEYSFNCGDCAMTINGLLEVSLFYETRVGKNNATFLCFLQDNPAHYTID